MINLGDMRQDQQQRPFVKYFPELSSMFNFLDDYSICEKHYNQIIVKSHIFFKKLQEDDIIYSSVNTSPANPHKFQRILDPSRIQYVLEEYSFRFINPLGNVEVRSQTTSNFLGK